MKVKLTNTPFLTASQIGELASALDNAHTRVIKAIERLHKDVATKKSEIANRWKNAHIDSAERAKIEAQEIIVSLRTIKDNSKAEMDRLFKEAGAAYHQIAPQKLYYDSPVKVLSRQALGDPRRTDYLMQLQQAGAAEIAHIGQVAVGTGNVALAAAVLSRLDAMPTNQRPFSAHDLASAIDTEYKKVTEYLKIAEARFQGVVLAIRAWQYDKANLIDSVSLAYRMRQIDQKVLQEIQDDEP